jgi:hypothetical protein
MLRKSVGYALAIAFMLIIGSVFIISLINVALVFFGNGEAVSRQELIFSCFTLFLGAFKRPMFVLGVMKFEAFANNLDLESYVKKHELGSQ